MSHALSQRQAAETRDLAYAAQAQVGDAPVMLKDSERSCAVCGVAVASDGEPKVVVEAVGRRGQPSSPIGMSPMRTFVAEFDVCDACQERAGRAAAIVAGHPRLAARLGPDTARLCLEHVFAALTALGQKIPDSLTEPALASLLHHLAAPGATCRWAAMFAPVQSANPRTCNPYGFAHLTPSQRRELRAGFAATLNDRMALSRPSQHLPPPTVVNGGVPVGDGCMFCGCATITRTAAQVAALGGPMLARREVWRPISADPHSLGGQRSPQRLSGFVCPDCAAAIDSAGSIGATALEKAYSRWLRSVGRETDAQRVERSDVTVVAWGARAWSLRQRGHPASPSEVSWSHIKLGL